MKTMLVTGRRGQLATALQALAPRFAAEDWRLAATGRPDFDFDRPETIAAVIAAIRPHLVINAAAWTAVDLAEREVEAARRANETGLARLAQICADAEIPVIHLSTDYVFDGSKGAPYRETDQPNPINVYGASKLAGERHVLAAGGRTMILRTSWLYAATGTNFVRAMLAAARRETKLRIVADQRGAPTNADDLAEAILALILRTDGGRRNEFGGVFHAAGSGDTTWFGFAEAIFAAAARHGRPVPELTPITTAEWPTPARRPADTRLDCHKLEAVFALRLPPWRESLDRAVVRICAEEAA
ncbi:MAG: dTDP-4-dehydrorhamnose reductase [Stellaceae bacterium]